MSRHFVWELSMQHVMTNHFIAPFRSSYLFALFTYFFCTIWSILWYSDHVFVVTGKVRYLYVVMCCLFG